MVHPRQALFVVASALLPGAAAHACASCGAGDPSLAVMGTEKPVAGRVRLSSEVAYRYARTPVPSGGGWFMDYRNADGSLGAANDVRLAGINHKLGQRGIVNTFLKFGESGQCVGYLVGEPHQGLKAMFAMMNAERIAVGKRGYRKSCNQEDISKLIVEMALRGDTTNIKSCDTILTRTLYQKLCILPIGCKSFFGRHFHGVSNHDIFQSNE